MGTRSATPTVDEVLSELSRRQGRLVEAYMRELVPGYVASLEPRLGDMREAAQQTMTLIVAALLERRPLAADEMHFIRPYFRHAVLRGATQAELVRSARIWHRVITRAVEDLAGADGAALAQELSPLLLQYVDVMGDAAVVAAEEIAEARELTARESRRSLVDALVTGERLAADALAVAGTCGLDDERPYVVVVARPVGEIPHESALSVAAAGLARAGRDATEPLFALREGEAVIVRAVGDRDLGPYVDQLAEARAALLTEGTRMTLGVSARHTGLADARRAYEEAVLAREHAPVDSGVLALPLLGPLDYLFLRGGDETAWSLVPQRVREFVDADLDQASLLVDTLMAYVDCSLNVKAAAERLYVHPNTAHYRLGKIETQTGCDLRSLQDLQGMVVAVRLARHRRGLG